MCKISFFNIFSNRKLFLIVLDLIVDFKEPANQQEREDCFFFLYLVWIIRGSANQQERGIVFCKKLFVLDFISQPIRRKDNIVFVKYLGWIFTKCLVLDFRWPASEHEGEDCLCEIFGLDFHKYLVWILDGQPVSKKEKIVFVKYLVWIFTKCLVWILDGQPVGKKEKIDQLKKRPTKRPDWNDLMKVNNIFWSFFETFLEHFLEHLNYSLYLSIDSIE
jgi:hypothetical protein